MLACEILFNLSNTCKGTEGVINCILKLEKGKKKTQTLFQYCRFAAMSYLKFSTVTIFINTHSIKNQFTYPL
jgi:hypothetical protein